MRRICCECGKGFGEKCGVCGSTNLAIERYADVHPEFADMGKEMRRVLCRESDRFLCLDCGEKRPRGFGGESYGYCEPCKSETFSRFGLRNVKGADGVEKTFLTPKDRLISAWCAISAFCNRAWIWFQNFGVFR